MATIEKREKIKNIISGGIGNEPYFALPAQPTKLELISALNYYSKSSTTKESKEFILDFLEGYDAELKEKVKKVKDKWFTNIGFVLRLSERNYILPEKVIDDTIKKIKDIVDSLLIDDDISVEPIIEVKSEPVKIYRNESLYLLDDSVEDAMVGKKIDNIAVVGTTKELKETRQIALKEIQELEENVDSGYNPTTIKLLKPIYQLFVKQIDIQLRNKQSKRKRKQKPIPAHIKDIVGKRYAIFKDSYDRYIIFQAGRSLLDVNGDIVINHKSRLSFQKRKKGFVDKLKACSTIVDVQNLIKEFAGDITIDETVENKKINNKYELIIAMK